jgi:multiple sugar transport system permease protein/putative aldouronate transport system permease protein
LFLGFVLVAYPLIYILSASLSEPEAVYRKQVWLWPIVEIETPLSEAINVHKWGIGIDFTGYKPILKDPNLWKSYYNTIFYTVTGTALNMVLTILAAYPLSRKNFKAGKLLTLYFSFTLFFTGGLIPFYILMHELKLVGTRYSMILPEAVSVFYVIILKTFFQSGHFDELADSARLDGCSDFRYLLSFVMPLSKLILTIIALFYAVGHWNSYFNAMLYLNDKADYPLQMQLREILVINSIDLSMLSGEFCNPEDSYLKSQLKYPVIITAIAPVMLFYALMQKHISKFMITAAVKAYI